MISDLIAAFENLRSEKIQQARSRRRVERVMVANIKSWQVNRTKMTGLGPSTDVAAWLRGCPFCLQERTLPSGRVRKGPTAVIARIPSWNRPSQRRAPQLLSEQ
jgi:hypothetical protein